MTVLSLDHLNKAFGSLVVTDDICLDIAPGERHVIIGPNGAGKTSLVNQIGGQLKPSSGRILFKDRDITGLPPDRISRLGVARTFQRNNLFQNLSVIENIRLALEVHRGNPLDCFTPVGRNTALGAGAEELMAQVHLDTDGARAARYLSYGEQRQLEIGVALASAPELLLLDEPTSGMSPTETSAHDRPDRGAAADIVDPDDRARHECRILGRRPHHRPLLRQGAGDGHAGRNPSQ